MKGFTIFFSFFFLFLVSCSVETGAAAAERNNVYIVYMGAASSNGSLKNEHAQLLSSLSRRKGNSLIHKYRHGFSGFAARLSAEEATSIAKKPGVVSVFPDPMLRLHTTRSWDFLMYQTDLAMDSNFTSESNLLSNGSDTIIGIIDTGIWPESESFNDKDMGPIPSRWNGTCMTGKNFNSSNCNRKIIGAKFYEDVTDITLEYETPRDMVGHGTHVAATAAGRLVPNVSYYGLAQGTAKGGSPKSRIAVYRTCTPNGCLGSSILAAFDDAISDHVDVISLSLGSDPLSMLDFVTDPIAIGAFHAVQKGITVVCSGGNDGPTNFTVVNIAPWIITVAATTIDRDFESDVVLGGNKVIKGEGINFANIQDSPVYPLISAKKSDTDISDAGNCFPPSWDKDIARGKIVLFDNEDSDCDPNEKIEALRKLEGTGLILIDDLYRDVGFTSGDFPMTVISSKDGAEILSYINSTKNPVATIIPTKSLTEYKPAPKIATFSSRGPSQVTRNIIKPDIAAPGVNILAAWKADDKDAAPEGKKPTLYNLVSGTSMSCPHVSGIVATVKSQNPTWSPSAIRSAIMTTAIQTNNLGNPITMGTDSTATPYDFGAGEVTTIRPIQPGLVYETTTVDYLNFLCYYGYETFMVSTISTDVPDNFTCPEESTIDLISNINYPSIAISSFNGTEGRNVSRTVMNVAGDNETVYSVSVDAPAGVQVKVTPETLNFTMNGQKLTYQVTFSSTASSLDKDEFGSITWSNEKYTVRSPFVVSSKKSDE